MSSSGSAQPRAFWSSQRSSYGTRRSIAWHSPGTRYECDLTLGALGLGWRPEGWSPEVERYPPSPGWSIARYGWQPGLRWWVVRGANRSWKSVSVPLWMPFVFFAIPTGILWYRGRHSIPETVNRWLERLRPRRRKRVTLRLVVAFAVIHAVVAAVGSITFMTVYDFFFPPEFGEWRFVDVALEGALPFLVWGTPIWGIAWAWLFVRLRNKLLTTRPSHYCIECGYDLTGNVSGRCPECGSEVPALFPHGDGPRGSA